MRIKEVYEIDAFHNGYPGEIITFVSFRTSKFTPFYFSWIQSSRQPYQLSDDYTQIPDPITVLLSRLATRSNVERRHEGKIHGAHPINPFT